MTCAGPTAQATGQFHAAVLLACAASVQPRSAKIGGKAKSMIFRICALSLALAAPAIAAPGTIRSNPEQGGRGVPVIPEPMIFDMIRPLGAVKGELEANVLAIKPLNGEPLAWAPEIEVAVADGLALELELPMTGTRVDSLKLGVQGTFGTGLDGRFVHGIQYLGTIDRAGRLGSSVLYLAGVRYDRHWSSMTMIGAKAKNSLQPGRAVLLANHSLFRDVGRSTTAGVEVNHMGGRAGSWLVVPQLHQRLGHRAVVQLGAGVEKPRGERKTGIASLRVVGEF